MTMRLVCSARAMKTSDTQLVNARLHPPAANDGRSEVRLSVGARHDLGVKPVDGGVEGVAAELAVLQLVAWLLKATQAKDAKQRGTHLRVCVRTCALLRCARRRAGAVTHVCVRTSARVRVVSVPACALARTHLCICRGHAPQKGSALLLRCRHMRNQCE